VNAVSSVPEGQSFGMSGIGSRRVTCVGFSLVPVNDLQATSDI
jgi:hypothetical protein